MADTDGYLREPNPRAVAKLAIIDQLSDAELTIFLAMRNGTAALPLSPAQQIRLALRWDSAGMIDRQAEDVRQGFTAVFGAARMAELLGE